LSLIQKYMNLVGFIYDSGLIDLGFVGASFIWCNNQNGRARLWERLDHALVNGLCLD